MGTDTAVVSINVVSGPPVAPLQSGGLGCGEWHAWLTCRGGSDLIELPFTQLSMTRRLDDMSDASVSVGHFTGEGELISPGFISDECCGVLAELEPWEHELALYRDGALVWCGPVIKPVYTPETITIAARDLFQWFERRLLPRDRDFVGVDLAQIFRQLAVDALHRDPSPNITIAPTDTGIPGDRTILLDSFRRAADEMRELLRTGLDMTMVARTMRVGGVEVPTADLGSLITEHFDDMTLDVDGLQTETESTVVGSSTDTILGPVSAVAGSPVIDGVRTIDPRRGLVQNVVTESGIEDEDSAMAAAQSRLDLLAETPNVFTARILPTAPIQFDDLIPGARTDLRVRLMCRSVVGNYRFQSLAVNVDQGGEKVTGTWQNLGTTPETLPSFPSIIPKGTYTDWFFPVVADPGYNNFRATVTPLSDPSPDGFFWANQFGFRDGEGGYIGLQTRASGTPDNLKGAIFSIWLAIDVYGPEVAQPFGGEGVGMQTLITYPWVVGTSYTMRVSLSAGAPPGKNTTDGPWYDGLVKNETTGVETFIGSIQVPSAWDRINDFVVSFTEYYTQPPSTCDAIPYTAATFTNMRMNLALPPDVSDADPPDSHVNHLSTQGNCFTSAVADVTGGAKHEMGL